MDSKSDTVTGTIRYRIIKGFTVYAEYSGERIERNNSELWEIPSKTVKNTFSLSTNIRPANNIEIKTKYIHQDIDSPAYNNEPEHSDEGRLSLNWKPAKSINGLFMYSLAWQKRDGLSFTDDIQINADRKVKRERFFGSLTFLLRDDLNISPNFSYIRNRTSQSITYENISPPPDYYIDPDVLYRDIASIYGLALNYTPKDRLSLNLDITYTVSKGTFCPGSLISDVKSIKELEIEADIRESALGLRADYDLKKGWSTGIRYSFIDYNDRRDDSQDGRLHLIFASISKRW